MVTDSRLKHLLTYDPDSGLFFWNVPRKRGQVKAGDVAGYVGKNGYVIIGIDGREYFAHTLAWFYVTGEWVTGLDHKNRKRDDNSFTNLRKATQSEQNANTSIRSDNASGVKGVYFDKRRNSWQVEISFEGNKYYLGAYKDLEIAKQVAEDKRRELHGSFSCNG